MAAKRKPRSPSAAGGDHLRFLRPGALARLRDARLRRQSRTPYLLPPMSPEEPEPTSPPLAAAGDGGIVPYFVPASRHLAPRCPQRKRMRAAKSVVLFSPPPLPSPDLPVELVAEFLNQPDMVLAAH